MLSCALRSCNSRYGKSTGRDFSLFSFPTANKIEREKWIKFVQTERCEENWLPTNASKLCSKHFSSQDIYCGKTGRTVLKKGSLPYIKSRFQVDGIIEGVETNRVTPINVDVSDSESIFDTPRKIALKAQVHKLQKQKLHHQAKIKKLRQENRYLKLKVLNLKDLSNHLEKKFDIQKNVANSVKSKAKFLNSTVFEGLIIHSFESPAMLNHRLHLIKSVIETYAYIKLRYIAKFDPSLQKKSKRQKYIKLILFQGT